MQLTVGVERETDGRWIAAVDPIGALAYGGTRAEAIRKAKAVALEVIADRLAHGESPLTGRKTRRPATFEGVRFVA
jgi:predicted RNase H-like HicB family nuclease